MSTPQPVITIANELVALGPMRRDLVPLYQAWINDLRVTRTLGRNWPMTLDAEIDWFDRIAKSDTSLHFTIYLPDTWKPIGTCGVFDIHKIERTAELGIMIGESDARGNGRGTAAVRLLCDYAFHALGLESMFLRTADFNIAGQRAYEKAGFSLIGRRRQSIWWNGEYHDMLYYDMLAADFTDSVVQPIIAGESR